jgi:hypothetical protein
MMKHKEVEPFRAMKGNGTHRMWHAERDKSRYSSEGDKKIPLMEVML